ncbi:MAG: hypothetical protein US52_C0042G0005 [candidate division WS6 bacterium GW2011_GWA2_37_6]|uniref:FERM domain-containing protein n=1 Tax=candidate division WS6 bacterium GW2011_GWA2_37_6 TaxID=1619087 RepID=A0A0G0JDQ2_9BACT|nr:MAG: hypothetical protein US52_C0042G0005 [candidate division WS6 bacterium GW2011_GWA2_37_6]
MNFSLTDTYNWLKSRPVLREVYDQIDEKVVQESHDTSSDEFQLLAAIKIEI